MAKLTDRAVRSAGAGRHGDGDGLYLVVVESGRRKWVLRFQISGARRDMGLGAYPSVSLAEARVAAADARKLIAQNVDPIAARAASLKAIRPVPTFRQIAQVVIEEAMRKSTNAQTWYQWGRHLGEAYSGPLLDRAVNEITTLDVVAVLKPVWHEKPEVARKLYPAIRRVFEYARIHLRDEHGIAMPDNPARWTDLKAMGFESPMKLSRGSHPSLPYVRLPAFVAELRGTGSMSARALEFLILTNVRTEAVLKAQWSDFDLDGQIWTVPLTNLKDRKYRKEGFRVPLSPRAMDIIRELSKAQISSFVFPGQSDGGRLSNATLLALLNRMNVDKMTKWVDSTSGRPITAHGFRATFRTWAEEVETFPHAVVEQAMGHQVGTQVERVYRRTDVLDKRRELMNKWGAFCEPLTTYY